MPRMMTVKQAVSDFFNGTVSKELLYREIRYKNLPHVKLSTGKILLDTQSLELWWDNKLSQSVQPSAVDKSKDAAELGKIRRIAE